MMACAARGVLIYVNALEADAESPPVAPLGREARSMVSDLGSVSATRPPCCAGSRRGGTSSSAQDGDVQRAAVLVLHLALQVRVRTRSWWQCESRAGPRRR